MKLARRTFLHLAAGTAVLPAISRMSWAQAYPMRPVSLIVFVPAGGTPDIIARLIGQSPRSLCASMSTSTVNGRTS